MNWIILTLISAFAIAIGHIFVKKLLFKEHAQEFLTTLSMSVTIVLFLVLFPHVDFEIPFSAYVIIYVKSLIVTTGWILSMKAYRHTDISEVAPLTNLSPLFIVALSFFLLGEVLNILQFAGIAMMIIGVYLLETKNHSRSVFEPFKMFKRKYVGYLMIALILFAFSSIIDKSMTQNMNPYNFIFLSYFFIAINCLVIQYYKYNGIKDVIHVLKKSGALLILIVLLYAITDVAYISAVAVPASLISLIIPLKRINTVFETLMGGKMFKEKNISRKVIACIILVAGVYLIIAG